MVEHHVGVVVGVVITGVGVAEEHGVLLGDGLSAQLVAGFEDGDVDELRSGIVLTPCLVADAVVGTHDSEDVGCVRVLVDFHRCCQSEVVEVLQLTFAEELQWRGYAGLEGVGGESVGRCVALVADGYRDGLEVVVGEVGGIVADGDVL